MRRGYERRNLEENSKRGCFPCIQKYLSFTHKLVNPGRSVNSYSIRISGSLSLSQRSKVWPGAIRFFSIVCPFVRHERVRVLAEVRYSYLNYQYYPNVLHVRLRHKITKSSVRGKICPFVRVTSGPLQIGQSGPVEARNMLFQVFLLFFTQ